MTKKNGKKSRVVLIIIIIVAVVLGFLYFRGRNAVNNVLSSYTVTEVIKQDMQTTVRGNGVVESQNKIDVYAPSSIMIDEVYAENGDDIAVGDAIAKIDKDAYLDAEQALKDAIDQIDLSINSMYSSKGVTGIYTTIAGTVKEVNIENEDMIEAVMNKDGYLMIISADDNMRLDLVADDVSMYTEGDSVKVKIGDEIVDAVITEINDMENTLKIIFEDDDYTQGEEVTVFDADDKEIGAAEMKVNVPVYIEGDAGRVTYVYAKVGDTVSVGKKLVRIADNDASADLISLTEQRADLQNQLDDLHKGLEEIGLGSDYIIYAQNDGIMDELMLTPYGAVAEGMKMFTIQSIQPLMMYIAVDELDIANVEVGQAVEVKFEALAGETYMGEVAKINSLGQSINGVTNYTIQVVIEDTGDILIGMSGNIKIMTEEKKDVITVPVEAVQLIDDEYYVILGEDANIKTVADHKIETGLNDGAFIEVIDGLSEGDLVAIPVEEGVEVMFGPGR